MEKFEFKDEPVSAHQLETLIIMMEEASEVQQRASKLIRFGPDEVQPGQELSNVERLSMEVGDLLTMIEIAEEAGLICSESIQKGKLAKRKQLEKFMKTYGE